MSEPLYNIASYIEDAANLDILSPGFL